jgi:hypothetical protein
MTWFRSMSTPLRFPIWLLSTLPVMFAVGALGYLLPASGIASPSPVSKKAPRSVASEADIQETPIEPY